MNDLVPKNFGQVSTRFANTAIQNDLAAGVQAGFGIIGYKGKVWSLRHRGEEQQIMRPDGDGPANSIEVVILKAAPYISKIWYEKGYVEGSTAPPDCFSPNGTVPDPSSTKKQHNVCASCPQNAWGSKLTEAGKKGKACGDSKRMAVVPMNDILNEVYGGPMLLRVPAASLQDLASFGNKMQNLGYPYYAIATRISFDHNEAYPKFVFNAIRPLTDEEADQVIALHNSEEVKRVLAEGAELQQQEQAPPMETVQNAFEQPPEQPKAAAQKPAAKPAQTTAAKPAETKPAETKPAETKPAAKANGFGGATAAPKTEAKPDPKNDPKNAIPDDDDSQQLELEEAIAAAGDAAGEGDTPEGNSEQSDFEKSLDDQLADLLQA
jgi:hypothetical protein